MEKSIRIVVSGRVQGVFFRASARDQAIAAGIAGFVRNLPDGRVEIVGQGPTDLLEEFIGWCKEGPPGARVGDCKIEEYTSGKVFSGFEILY